MITLNQLNIPSLAEIRVNLITEKLIDLPASSKIINIFVSGRSASGKTTLGNRLIGESYFLSTGRQNTTQVVNLIEFSSCLRFFDLPGVDGGGRQEGDRLENYNRAALGLKQYPTYPHVAQITVASYNKSRRAQEHTYSLNDFNKFQFVPDVVYYLVDPKKGLTNSEKEYLEDLIDSEFNTLFIVNTWLDGNRMPLATKQNLEDLFKDINHLYANHKGKKQPVITKVNCQSGEGIEHLLEKTSISLGDERGSIFDQIILAQHGEAPKHYIRLIKYELSRIFIDFAEYKPTSHEDARERLYSTCRLLWNYLSKFKLDSLDSSLQSDLPKPDLLYSDFEKTILLPIKTIILGIEEHCYVPIGVSLPFFETVYRYKQLYRTEEEIVDDEDRPLYRDKRVTTDPGIWGGLGNLLQGKEWENINYIKEFKGFAKKKVSKQIYIGSKREFSHIRSWLSLIGLKRYSHTIYQPFGIHGLCLLKCFCVASISSNFEKNYEFKNQVYSYRSTLMKLERMASIHEAGIKSTKEKRHAILLKNIEMILNMDDFDDYLIASFVENSNKLQTARKYLIILKQAQVVIDFRITHLKILYSRIIFGLREIFLEGDRQRQIDPIWIQLSKLIENYFVVTREIALEIFKNLTNQSE